MKKFIFIVCFFVAHSLAAQSAATVLFARDAHIVKQAEGKTKASRGARLQAGDGIVTSKKGLVKLKYNNGTNLALGADSDYTILAYSPSREVQIKAELKAGKAHVTTTGKKKNKELLKTPTIALAIVGTDVEVYISGKSVYVRLNEGVVWAGNQRLAPGSYLISPDGKITKASFPSQGVIQKISSIETLSDAVNLATVVQQTGVSTTADIAAVPPVPVLAGLEIISCTNP